MANPEIHSKSSVKRWGGKVEDYIAIHELIDSPKASNDHISPGLRRGFDPIPRDCGHLS